MTEALSLVKQSAESGKRCFVSTPNLNFVIACQHDTAFRNSVINGDLSIADGMPLVWVARMLKMPIYERVSGAGLFEALCAKSGQKLKIFFFGGGEGVAESACQNLNRTADGALCVGFRSPGFMPIEEMSTCEVIADINDSGADFLVVALGAKKGNTWIEHNMSKLTVPVVSHLGAVVNFAAGEVARAPVWMQRMGLEWVWRIKEEPALWRRYWHDGFAFLKLFVTRVLPYAWFLKRKMFVIVDSSATIVCQDNFVVINLKGIWVASNLEVIRELFRDAATNSIDIKVDVADVVYIDNALIGLLMLLHGHQYRHGRKLIITSASAQLKNIFRWNCAEYLLDFGV